jgi:large subunit ribosomal protein L24
MSAIKLKVGDKVKVISGSQRGTVGKILQVLPAKSQVVVEGVNIVKKHVKPGHGQSTGSIQEVNKPVDISKVQFLVDETSGKTSRIGYQIKDGKKIRVTKTNGKEIN